MRLDALLAHAAALGLDVQWADLGEVRRGQYRDAARQITICRSLTRVQATATLAHEIGHAIHGDRCSTPASERRAWETGARLVIDVDEYRAAESVVGDHPLLIANELGVTRHLVESWQGWYRRSAWLREARSAPVVQ